MLLALDLLLAGGPSDSDSTTSCKGLIDLSCSLTRETTSVSLGSNLQRSSGSSFLPKSNEMLLQAQIS